MIVGMQQENRMGRSIKIGFYMCTQRGVRGMLRSEGSWLFEGHKGENKKSELSNSGEDDGRSLIGEIDNGS